MAQFQSRPETPDEWGGLPSEPFERTDSTELEREIAASDALTLGFGDALGSILIPTAPLLAEAAQAAPAEPVDEETDPA